MIVAHDRQTTLQSTLVPRTCDSTAFSSGLGLASEAAAPSPSSNLLIHPPPRLLTSLSYQRQVTLHPGRVYIYPLPPLKFSFFSLPFPSSPVFQRGSSPLHMGSFEPQRTPSPRTLRGWLQLTLSGEFAVAVKLVFLYYLLGWIFAWLFSCLIWLEFTLLSLALPCSCSCFCSCSCSCSGSILLSASVKVFPNAQMGVFPGLLPEWGGCSLATTKKIKKTKKSFKTKLRARLRWQRDRRERKRERERERERERRGDQEDDRKACLLSSSRTSSGSCTSLGAQLTGTLTQQHVWGCDENGCHS